jgi:Leu/Phe-tRNA-protein transferase
LIKNLKGSRPRREGKEDKKDPLAPYPSRAMLTTRNAKWCHWATERRRMMEISRVRVAAEVRKIPRQRKFGVRSSEFGG